MIHLAIAQIVSELNHYLNLRSPGLNETRVVSGSLFDSTGMANKLTQNRVAVEIVNIEKETVYRSVQTYRTREDGTHEHVNPSVRINAYVLIVANLDDYGEALKAASLVLAFFQNRYTLEIPANGDGMSHVIFEMHSLTFEEQNHLWASLGAKYMPSVVYKASILDINDTRADAEVAPVQDIAAAN